MKAHLYHPDKNTSEDAAVIFRESVDAYEYALLHISEIFKYFGVEESAEDEETAKIFVENLDDIFEDIFGFSKRGRILGYQEPQIIYLKLEEFIFGVKKRQKLVAYEKCSDCKGVGAKRGSVAKICTYCFGQGKLKTKKDDPKKINICPKCKGRGRQIKSFCGLCDGFGRIKRFHMQELNLPIGLRPFEMYTLDSYDLHSKTDVQIFVEPRLFRDPIFQIDNYDLLCEYHLDFEVAQTGGLIHLKTPLGAVPVNIPEEAHEGDVIRISQSGLYKDSRKTARGDLVVQLKNKKKPFFKRLLGGWFD